MSGLSIVLIALATGASIGLTTFIVFIQLLQKARDLAFKHHKVEEWDDRKL